MPEPENGAVEELNPTVPDTTPDDPTETNDVVETPDAGADLAAAKIADLTAQLYAKDQRIAELQSELDAAKAHNYDLLMAGTGTEDDETPHGDPDDAGDDLDGDELTIEDILYEK